jgi:hypothetical protein
MGYLDYKLANMVPGPASSATVHVIYQTEDGVMICYGTAANTTLEADTSTYAPGCIYIRSLTAGSSVVYYNVGTKASPDFNSPTLA